MQGIGLMNAILLDQSLPSDWLIQQTVSNFSHPTTALSMSDSYPIIPAPK